LRFLYASPFHAVVLSLDNDAQTLGSTQTLNFVSKDHHRFLLDVRPGEHPISHTGELGEPNHTLTRLNSDPTVPHDWDQVVGASRTNAYGTNGINLIELLDVWKTRNLGLIVISTLEHLTEIHPSHALCRLRGVVIIVDINDQAAQKLPDPISNLVLEFIELTGLDEWCNIVIRQERNTLIDKALADSLRNGLDSSVK
jgi:hypothetical protein